MPEWPTDDGTDAVDPTTALNGGFESPPDPRASEPRQTTPMASDAGPTIPANDGDPYVDATGSLRLWVDEDRRLVEVKLSNRWRERSDQPLVERFRHTLRAAQERVSQPLPLPTSDLPGRAPGAEVPLDAVVRRLFELRAARRQLQARGDVARSSWTGTAGRGHSDDRQVFVGLDREERTVELTMDEDWVATARTDQIVAAVVQAHRAAYQAHVPGEFVPGEFGRLAQEAAALAAELAPRPTR